MDNRSERPLILIVDDSIFNCKLLTAILGNDYIIAEAHNGIEAVEILHEHNSDISLVMLDIVMPEMDGFKVLEKMNDNQWITDIPVIMISSEDSSEFIDKSFNMGVTDFISRPFNPLVVKRRVENTIQLYAKQKRLSELAELQIYEKNKNSNMLIAVLSHIVEYRNGESGIHVIHVRKITELLLRSLIAKTDKYGLTGADVPVISTASALHDIGKISISNDILNKPGRFTDEEYEIMKTHSLKGAIMLETIPFQTSDPLLKSAYEICRWHHERYDGKGYPDGLAGDEIPISAQVVSLADVYDALTSARVYKGAYSHDDAINMIKSGQCGCFNPLLIECLDDISDLLRSELRTSFASSDIGVIDISDEISENKDLSDTNRAINMYKYERRKNKFYNSISDDLIFEYTNNPPILTVTALTAERLGIPTVVSEPLSCKELINSFNDGFVDGLRKALQTTTQKMPVFIYDGTFQGNPAVICGHAVWLDKDNNELYGFYGKLTERNKQ